MKANHTPGPWTVDEGGILPSIMDARQRFVCDICGDRIGVLENAANASLIAASPNLLSACEKALKDARMFGGMGSDTMTELEDAIKLAKGGEA